MQLAIGAIVLPATLVLGIFAIRKVKRQGDRVRKGFVWFHTALWILLLYVTTPPPYRSRYSQMN